MTTPERTGTTYEKSADVLVEAGEFREPIATAAGDRVILINGQPPVEDVRILAESTYLALVRTTSLSPTRTAPRPRPERVILTAIRTP